MKLLDMHNTPKIEAQRKELGDIWVNTSEKSSSKNYSYAQEISKDVASTKQEDPI